MDLIGVEDSKRDKNQNLDEEKQKQKPSKKKEIDEEEEEEEQNQKKGDDNDKNGEVVGSGADIEEEVKKKKEKQVLTPEEYIRINYYRWTFLFFFFHFFNFICTTDILNEFSIYLENDEMYDAFTNDYPNILPSIQALLFFNIFVLILMVMAFIITFRYTPKIFYICMVGFIFFYIGKMVCLFTSITIEKEMNDKFSEWYEDIQNDKKQQYCGPDDYSRCRIVFAWNFFKYEGIFDSVVTTITFVVYIWRVRKYKLQLIKELFSDPEFQRLNDTSKFDQSSIQPGSQANNNHDMNLENIEKNHDTSQIQN